MAASLNFKNVISDSKYASSISFYVYKMFRRGVDEIFFRRLKKPRLVFRAFAINYCLGKKIVINEFQSMYMRF